MTITIFKDHNCKGKSQVVGRNLADLKDQPADKPGSIRLTGDDEAVLLYKNDDWKGGALYIRGPKTVQDLGKADDGGRFGFGNSVRSVRITPFWVDLNVTIVKDAKGNLPGNWKTLPEARAEIDAMVAQVNDFFTERRALLQLVVARVNTRTDDKRFAISLGEQMTLPGEWTQRGEVDVVFVHRFSKEGALGRATFPCFGQAVVLAKMSNPSAGADSPLETDLMAYVLAHELGHHFGLAHGTSNDNSGNLMFPTAKLNSLDNALLWPDQIREMHDKLANNISRKGERTA
jgi:hypothetical protein